MTKAPVPPKSSFPMKRIRQIVIWIIASAFLLLLLPAYLISQSISEGVVDLQAEYDTLQMTITSPPVVPDAEGTLVSELVNLRNENSQFQETVPTLVAAHIDWPAIMNFVGSFDRTQLRLTSFTHEGGRLTLEGDAVAEFYVLEYVEALQATNIFERVQLQSISANPTAGDNNRNATPEAQADTMFFSFSINASLGVQGDASTE